MIKREVKYHSKIEIKIRVLNITVLFTLICCINKYETIINANQNEFKIQKNERIDL